MTDGGICRKKGNIGIRLTAVLLMVLMLVAYMPMLGGEAYAEGVTYTNTTDGNPVGGFPNNYGPILSTDKSEYTLDENIYLKVENSASATSGGWIGIYESVDSNSSTTTKAWAYTGSETVADVEDYIIYGPDMNSGVTVNSALTAGNYYIILMANDGRWAVLPITITSGGTTPDPVESSISTDKTEYEADDDIIVTAESGNAGAWVGLYKKDDNIGTDTSFYWYNVSAHNGTPFNILEGSHNERDGFGAGEYSVVLFANDKYDVDKSVDITIKPGVASSLATNKRSYKVGEPILVTATSSNRGAWVGFYDYLNAQGEDVNLASDLKAYYYVKGFSGQEVDILNAENVIDKDKVQNLPAGRYKVILFANGGYDIDADSSGLLIKSFYIDHYYGAPEWSWSQDYTTATATFHCVDDESLPAITLDAAVTSQVTKEATCKEAGEITYVATVNNVTEENGEFLTESGETTFTDTKTVVTDIIPHDWSDWTVITEATTEAAGLEKHTCALCGEEETREIPKIEILDIKDAEVSKMVSKTWTGKEVKQNLVITLNDKTLTEGTDYTVTYKNNKNIGKATLTIKGIGKYTGTVTKAFEVIPKGTSISKLTPAKKAFTVKWTKRSTKMPKSRITGYQIKYSTSKDFSNAKKVSVKGYSKTSKKIYKLKAKTTYYEKIRTYIKIGGTTYWSDWSKTSTVKTK